MLYVSIVHADGHHSELTADGPELRLDLKLENATLILHARDGASSVRLRLEEPLIGESRLVLGAGPPSR